MDNRKRVEMHWMELGAAGTLFLRPQKLALGSDGHEPFPHLPSFLALLSRRKAFSIRDIPAYDDSLTYGSSFRGMS